MKLKANRPLVGSYGYVQAGTIFDTDDNTAGQLMKRGLAEQYHEPDPLVESAKAELKVVQTYEVKVIEPGVGYAVKSEPESTPLTTESLRRRRGRPRKS